MQVVSYLRLCHTSGYVIAKCVLSGCGTSQVVSYLMLCRNSVCVISHALSSQVAS